MQIGPAGFVFAKKARKPSTIAKVSRCRRSRHRQFIAHLNAARKDRLPSPQGTEPGRCQSRSVHVAQPEGAYVRNSRESHHDCAWARLAAY